jgi:hypothetical protein
MDHRTVSEALTDHQRQLYGRLQDWCFDPPDAAMPFVVKLARDQGWSLAQSERVIGEYRRFLFLALEAGHPVSPSRAVDLAWHQHLLGRPLHHTPSRGGKEERQRMGEWYCRTLASYRALFGELPPPDLWPPADPSVVPPRPPRRRPPRWGILLGSFVLALMLSGCQVGAAHFPYSLSGPAFLLFYFGLAVAGCFAVVGMGKTCSKDVAYVGSVLLFGGLWLLGAIRFLHGLSVQRPVGFLGIAMVGMSLALLFFIWNDPRKPRPSRGENSGDPGAGGASSSCAGGGCGGGCGGGGGGGCGG